MPSAGFVTSSFIESLDEVDDELIKQALKQDVFNEKFKLSLVELISKYSSNISTLPTPELFQELLNDLAFFVTFVKSSYLVDWMLKGISETDLTQFGVPEDIFQEYMNSLKPSGKDIALRLLPSYSCQESLRESEKRVFAYIKRLVSRLSKKDAAMFMRYATGFGKTR